MSSILLDVQRLATTLAVLGALAALWLNAPAALAHPGAGTPTPPPPTAPSLIPPDDEARYQSEVTAITPEVPGLDARIVGGQEQIEVSWSGAGELIIEGTEGEPMLRFGPVEIEVNERSPSAYASSERFGRVEPPPEADPDAPPRWRPIASAGSFSWYEHRAQWMSSDRPAVVGDGGNAVTIRDWTVPVTIGGRDAAIEGTLRWLPDPATIREQRSAVSSPLLSAAVLVGAMALGTLLGLRLRPRLMANRAPA